MTEDEFHDTLLSLAIPERTPHTGMGRWGQQQAKLSRQLAPPVKPAAPPPKPAPQPLPAWTPVTTPSYRDYLQTAPKKPRKPIQFPDWFATTAKVLGISAICGLAGLVTFFVIYGLVEYVGGEDTMLPPMMWVEDTGGGWLFLGLWMVWSALHYWAGIGVALLAKECAVIISDATIKAACKAETGIASLTEYCAALIKRMAKKAAHKAGTALIELSRRI